LTFSLCNHVPERARAFELSVLQDTVLIQTWILATVFFGETFITTKITAIILVFIGVLSV